MKKSENIIRSSNQQTFLRRNKSGTNFIKNDDDIKDILDTKINELSETFKKEKEEQHLINISNLLEMHTKTINNMITDTLERQKYLYEEREINHREKYDELLKKYNKLHALYEDQYFKFTKIISHYQYILFKYSIHESDEKFLKNERENNQTDLYKEYNEINKILEYNSEYEDNKRESLITNPITHRKYTNPIIKRSKVNIPNDTNIDSD